MGETGRITGAQYKETLADLGVDLTQFAIRSIETETTGNTHPTRDRAVIVSSKGFQASLQAKRAKEAADQQAAEAARQARAEEAVRKAQAKVDAQQRRAEKVSRAMNVNRCDEILSNNP